MDQEHQQAREAFQKAFPTREAHLGWQIVTLSQTGQPCDVTFYKRKPIFDVEVDPKINAALMYGAGTEKLQELFAAIRFSDGTVASWAEIWTINPMPRGGISDAELAQVDLADGETVCTPDGKTMREIIRETYQCENREREDALLRRFIAS